jgi:hypothetical protein
MEIIMTQSSKNKPGTLWQSFLYNKKVENANGSINWVCGHEKCYSSITTKDNIVIKINRKKADLLNNLSSHNHEPIGAI